MVIIVVVLLIVIAVVVSVTFCLCLFWFCICLLDLIVAVLVGSGVYADIVVVLSLMLGSRDDVFHVIGEVYPSGCFGCY